MRWADPGSRSDRPDRMPGGRRGWAGEPAGRPPRRDGLRHDGPCRAGGGRLPLRAAAPRSWRRRSSVNSGGASVDLTPVIPSGASDQQGRALLVDGLRAAIRDPPGRAVRRPAAGRHRPRGPAQRGLLRPAVGRPRAAGQRARDRRRRAGPPRRPTIRLTGWATGLAEGAIEATVAGHLTGSIDLVLRVPGGPAGPRFVVADYKTNALHPRGLPVGPDDYDPDRLVAAMEEHDYPLQALLYSVALHRYLRWRVPGYRPDAHLGGVAYLFLRGMTGPGWGRRGPGRGVRVGRSSRPGGRAQRPPGRAGRRGPGGMTLRTVTGPTGRPWSYLPGWRSWPPSWRPACSGPTRCSSPPPCSASSPGSEPEELLALAVAARAPRFGHVCTPLDGMALRLAELDGEEVDGSALAPGRRLGGHVEPLGRRGRWVAGGRRVGGGRRSAPPPGLGRRPSLSPAVLALRAGRRRGPRPPVRAGPPWAASRGPGRPVTRWTGCSTPCSAPPDPARPTCSGWPSDGRWPPGCRSSPGDRARGRPTRWPGSWPPPTWWPPGGAAPSPWRWPPPPARRRPAWARRSRPR